MKHFRIKSFPQTIILLLAAAFLLVNMGSCAKKVTFLNSSVVPAAQGTVKVKKDSNKNYHIQITMSNLAQPDRLQPPKKIYVIWMESENNMTKNIGQINSSSGVFSNKLKGSFQTVSSSRPTRIFISAEDDAEVQNPGTQIVLTTNSF